MGNFKKIRLSLLLNIMVTFFLASTSEASVHILQVKDGNTVIAKAQVDDNTPFTGLYSLVVDGTERLFQQWFWYRIGPAGKEASLESLTLKTVTPPSTTNPNTLTLTYSLPATFEITVNYVLTYPAGGNARLQKNISIHNISTTSLDYHLFEYSDFDVTDLPIQNDNLEAVGTRIYQNGEQADGSGVTIVHESTLPPGSYDFDSQQIYLLIEMKDDAPTELSIPQTTYSYGDDMQFGLQWDLAIPVGQSVSFTITDDLYYTLPMAAAKTHIGCVTYGGEAHYTIAFDNLANTLDSLTNVKIIDFLPANTTPLSSPDALYDHSTHSVTWNLPSLAAGAGQQTKQLSVTVNSPADFENEILLVSDQSFPARAVDHTLLCNHPPTMNSIVNATINEGAPYSLQIVALDPDNQDSLSYSLSGAPAGMTISTTGLISYPAGITGVYTITVTAIDSGAGPLSVSKTFTLTVITPNQPPLFTSTPPISAAYNQLYTYPVIATDPDGDTLTYGLTKAPSGMSISSNVISWTPTTLQAGTHTIQTLISDGKGHYSYQNFSITVGATVNDGTRSKGDLDGNGIQTIADALLALQFAVGVKVPSVTEREFGDVAPIVNGKSMPDGVIGIADALALLQKSVGLLSW